MTDAPGFSGDGRPVVLLTLREAQAVRTALQQWALSALKTDDSDLSRGYRVLSNQIDFVESTIQVGRRRRTHEEIAAGRALERYWDQAS